MRIKYNVKGAHEPTQSTMTRTLSPLGKRKHIQKLALKKLQRTDEKKKKPNVSKARDKCEA